MLQGECSEGGIKICQQTRCLQRAFCPWPISISKTPSDYVSGLAQSMALKIHADLSSASVSSLPLPYFCVCFFDLTAYFKMLCKRCKSSTETEVNRLKKRMQRIERKTDWE